MSIASQNTAAAHRETDPGTLSEDVAQRVINQNPLSYIGDPACDCAKHWYIWHGTMDGAVPINMSFDLVEKLKAQGITDVIFKIEFNGGHGRGDAEMIGSGNVGLV